jgi:hypothetical protein
MPYLSNVLGFFKWELVFLDQFEWEKADFTNTAKPKFQLRPFSYFSRSFALLQDSWNLKWAFWSFLIFTFYRNLSLTKLK